MAKHLVIFGASHSSAPIEIREQLLGPLEDIGSRAAELNGDVIQEIALLSTCNRVELVAAGPDPDAMLRALEAQLIQSGGFEAPWARAYMRARVDRDALNHLFRVAASLESVVVGEPQILGQMKDAYQEFFGRGMTGPLLNRVFHRAFYTAKRVRTETGIAENAVSVSYAAVQLAREELGDLRNIRVMVVGAGQMGVLAAKHLRSAGVGDILVLNRSIDRAQELAESEDVRGSAHSLDELDALLPTVDLVLTSTGASQFIFTPSRFEALPPRDRKLLVIDIAVPRDVDPACAKLPNLRLFDVDDLERVIDESLDYRRAEAKRAARIVSQEVDVMHTWLQTQDAIEPIVALRAHFQQVMEDELDRHVAHNAQWSDEQREAIRIFAQALLNKLLHPPTAALREADPEAIPALVAAIAQLFPSSDDEATP